VMYFGQRWFGTSVGGLFSADQQLAPWSWPKVVDLMWHLPVPTLILSLAGIVTFIFVLPLTGTPAIDPEWSWGFFSAAGGVFGSWCASKNQIHVPEHFLALFLGSVTGLVGLLYVLNAAGHQ